MNKEWDNNNINSYINDCINLENNIKNINIINDSINKYKKNVNAKIIFSPKEEDLLNKFLETIKTFGEIYYNCFRFKECPININENRKYSVTGENKNILTKTGTDCKWDGNNM